MSQIKICGVNDAAFAQAAERLGADYLGLIFAAGSPRQVTPRQAREILAGLTGRSKVVGVFTTGAVSDIAALARELGLGIIQLHRRASAEDIAFLKARGFEVWALAGGAAADAMLFDSSHGNGETTLRKGPWRTILAGGISQATLPAALATGADIIDVSSALETTPGRKSIEKLNKFMKALDF